MYKALQIEHPQTRNAKNLPLNRLSKYKPRGACTWKVPSILQSKTKQKR